MISRLRLASIVSVGLVAASLLAIVWQLVLSRTIEVGGGCGYDGVEYCKMFHGGTGVEPFGRRILAPRLAALLSTDPLVAFRILDGLVIAGTLVVALALVLLAKRQRPETIRTEHVVAVLIVASVVLAARDLLRFVLSYPVITDPLALFLLLVAAYGILRLGQSPWWVALAAGAGFLAPLAREVFGVAIVAGAATAVLLKQAGWLRGAIVAAAALAGTAVAFAQVRSSSTGGVASVMWGWVVSDFGSLSGLVRFATMLLIGLGFFWVPMLWPRFWRALQPAETILLALAGVLLLVSVFGGGDTDRIVMPVGILLAIVIGRIATRDSTTALGLAFLAAAYFVAQYPFTVVGGSADAWIAFFSLRDSPAIQLADNGVAPDLLAAPLAAAGVVIMVRGERTTDGRQPAAPTAA